MSIRITTTLPAQTQLFSTSELICALNAAESRFNRAVRDAEITPLGTVGRVTLFAVTLLIGERNPNRRGAGGPIKIQPHRLVRLESRNCCSWSIHDHKPARRRAFLLLRPSG